jgi:hypothetical protein
VEIIVYDSRKEGSNTGEVQERKGVYWKIAHVVAKIK